jgi:indolepyruvate ferredoxin oxidoreductase beta subunit
MPTESRRTRISVAIAALGGQGGGVLADWLVHTGEAAGWVAQSTSVPGVAQRTGTTVYYVELAPRAARPPVLALMPVPGDVDLAVGAELMEAGRAILRGFVTPERTTLVASTHRVYGITEKAALGDGRASDAAVMDAARASARRLVAFDMQAAADRCGGQISAVLLGAIAASGALPFAREHYEHAIKEYGVAVAKNLEAFKVGFDGAAEALPTADRIPVSAQPTTEVGRRLDARIRAAFPAHLHGLIAAGAERVLSYLDEAYAALYLDRLERFRALDLAGGGARAAGTLTATVARYLALWMSYEDTYRVADLKTRAARFARFRAEVRAAPDQIVHVTEFMHPRYVEICESMPAALGARMLKSPRIERLFRPLVASGRHVSTARLRGFLPLWLLARFGHFRRGTLRYRLEQQRIERWLDEVYATAGADYDLAVELAECQRLVKGYGDTHERGLRNFSRIFGALATLRSRERPAEAVRRLRSAALADEDGRAFAKAWSELALS